MRPMQTNMAGELTSILTGCALSTSLGDGPQHPMLLHVCSDSQQHAAPRLRQRILDHITATKRLFSESIILIVIACLSPLTASPLQPPCNNECPIP
ncbi:uncharacterized protein BDV17DRAFT_255977 [Aspergillus undulatus]|uniref:uncharacterized protein n=1 Tax=Aspergillus undulatus TaxID=1810928 RepID=UPI003CCCD95C